MKRILLTVAAAAVLIACKSNKTSSTAGDTAGLVNTDTIAVAADTTAAPVIVFEQPKYDFGTVTEGEKVSFEFKFKNTGKTPLIISNAMASCGCTAPDYPKTPIASGQGGVISVVFNSTNQSGKQNKIITVTSNAATPVSEVYLTGEVKKLTK